MKCGRYVIVWTVRANRFPFQLTDKQCKDDGCRKRKDQRQYTDADCICQDTRKIIIGKKILKMLKAYPRTVHKTAGRRIVFKSNSQPEHRTILEYRVEKQNRYKQKIQLPVLLKIYFYFLPECLLQQDEAP
jgi:hypothetical protein